MVHKSEVDHYEQEMELLVERIGDLKYDALTQFLSLLSEKINGDGLKDEARGRIKAERFLINSNETFYVDNFLNFSADYYPLCFNLGN